MSVAGRNQIRAYFSLRLGALARDCFYFFPQSRQAAKKTGMSVYARRKLQAVCSEDSARHRRNEVRAFFPLRLGALARDCFYFFPHSRQAAKKTGMSVYARRKLQAAYSEDSARHRRNEVRAFFPLRLGALARDCFYFFPQSRQAAKKTGMSVYARRKLQAVCSEDSARHRRNEVRAFFPLRLGALARDCFYFFPHSRQAAKKTGMSVYARRKLQAAYSEDSARHRRNEVRAFFPLRLGALARDCFYFFPQSRQAQAAYSEVDA